MLLLFMINDICDFDNEHQFCNKCYLTYKSKNEISNVYIFNKINDIIYSSKTMPEVYYKIDNLNVDFDKWIEKNREGYTVFHWYAWMISIKIKKYYQIKPLVFAFFQKVFGDNTIISIFNQKQIDKIVKLTTSYDNEHTVLYHLVRYCENPNDNYYRRLYNILLINGSKEITNEQINKIKKYSVEECNLPDNIKKCICNITTKYKNIEELIIENITNKYSDLKLSKCIMCNNLIDYTKEIPKIIDYAKQNGCSNIMDLIWIAYYQRKLLNKIFDNYYKYNNIKSELNMIHKRHTHVLDIYSNHLIESN